MPGRSKLTDLDEAVSNLVAPGMVLHIDPGAQAAVRSLLRVFRGKRPGFTIVSPRAGFIAPDLLQAGLVQRVITGGFVNPGLRAGSCHAMQSAFRDPGITLENWSLYTIVLRLMAGALRWPFVPTHSIAGSTMATDNSAAFRAMENPFDGNRPAHVLAPLTPDVSFLHAVCADASGAAVLLPPYDGDHWAARAARSGTVVTAERIVDTDTVRRHAHFVQLPPNRVLAVSAAPHGSHPYEASSAYPDLFEGYPADATLLEQYQQAVRTPESHEQWLEDWVYRFKTHAEYLAVAIPEEPPRAPQMKPLAAGPPAEPRASECEQVGGASVEERIVIAAARRIIERVLDERITTILVGTGIAADPCAMAHRWLAELDHEVLLARGTGAIGWFPDPGNPTAEAASALMLAGTHDTYGAVIGGEGSRSLAVLGAAQVDPNGNLNSTYVAESGIILTGSGGANDAASLATESLVVCRFRPDRFLLRVDYVTCPGARVSTVITDLGIFTRPGPESPLELTSYIVEPDDAVRRQVDVLVRRGWRVSEDVSVEAPVTPRELSLARAVRSGTGG